MCLSCSAKERELEPVCRALPESDKTSVCNPPTANPPACGKVETAALRVTLWHQKSGNFASRSFQKSNSRGFQVRVARVFPSKKILGMSSMEKAVNPFRSVLHLVWDMM